MYYFLTKLKEKKKKKKELWIKEIFEEKIINNVII